MKTRLARALGIAAAVILTGVACGSSPAGAGNACPASKPCTGDTTGSYSVTHVQVDGRTVPCIVWEGTSKGGISCDWSPR